MLLTVNRQTLARSFHRHRRPPNRSESNGPCLSLFRKENKGNEPNKLLESINSTRKGLPGQTCVGGIAGLPAIGRRWLVVARNRRQVQFRMRYLGDQLVHNRPANRVGDRPVDSCPRSSRKISPWQFQKEKSGASLTHDLQIQCPSSVSRISI